MATDFKNMFSLLTLRFNQLSSSTSTPPTQPKHIFYNLLLPHRFADYYSTSCYDVKHTHPPSE
jgi:hypothetical protein